MPTPQSVTRVIDNLMTTTWYDIRPQVTDYAFQITPFYDKMVESGRIKERVPDGTHFEIPIRYAKQDGNIQWFGTGATFSEGEQESLTRLIFEIKNFGTSISRYWNIERKNKGKTRLINYVEELLDNTKMSLADALSAALLSPSSDPLAIDSLPDIITTTPTTGTYGGLTRSEYGGLQNNTIDFSSLTTSGSLLDKMTQMYNECTLYKGGRRSTPNIILTSREVYQDYEAICRALQIISTNKTERASLGFGELMFKNVEVFWDPNCPQTSSTEQRMYFLNTDHLELAYDPDSWFDMTEWKSPHNKLDRYAQIVSVCQFFSDFPAKHGVIYDISPDSA